MNYKFEYQEPVEPFAEDILFEGINAEAILKRDHSPIKSFGFFLKGASGTIQGGLTAMVYYGCLYIDMLWVAPHLRNHDWGTKLMQKAEKTGLDFGSTFSTVNTMDWEALPFYQKLGYQVEFTRYGYNKGSKMYFLRKALSN